MHDVEPWLVAGGGVVFWISVLGAASTFVVFVIAVIDAVAARRRTRRIPRAVGRARGPR